MITPANSPFMPKKTNPSTTAPTPIARFNKVQTNMILLFPMAEMACRFTACRQPAKPAKPAKVSNDNTGLHILWKKVGGLLEKGFEGTLAGLYDDMGNNDEKEN